MYELKCQKCGGELTKNGEVFACGYCHTSYLSDQIEKEKAALSRILDEQKQEQLANRRHMLWEEIHAEYIDSEMIVNLCSSLRKLKPDDFEARFFEVANSGNSRQINDFLDSIDVDNPEQKFWVEEIVKFMIKSLRAENILALNDLIERAYKGLDLQKYEKYATHVSDEAKKVENGIYEPALPRDVFVMYSSKDFKKVKELVYHLEESGLKCFVAMRNLQHGRGAVANYQKALETAMNNCKVVVFLSSKNSRSIACDAVKVEIPYLKRADIMNAPYEYRQNYEQMPIKYKKPRVEYRLDNEGRGGGDMIVKEFFGSLEYTYSAEEVLARVITYLTQGVEEPVQEKPQEKYCLACGKKNIPETKFCMECGGREFVATKAEYEAAKSKREHAALEKAEREKQELLEKLKALEAEKEAEKARKAQEAEEARKRERQAEIAAYLAREEEVKRREEARRRAEEEAKRREEAQRRAEEEARRRAEEEKRRVEEEIRRRAEEEKRRAEEEARRKVEEERRAQQEREKQEREQKLFEERFKAEAANVREKHKKELGKVPIREGNFVWFGSYAGQPIKWRILKEENGAAWVVSEHILDAVRFDYRSNDYAKSPLSFWVENTFYKEAFTLFERLSIMKVEELWKGVKVRLFLLKESEVVLLGSARKKEATPYAREKFSAENMNHWWTRSSERGNYQNVYAVDASGKLCCVPSAKTLGFVPAMWIKLPK